MFNWTKNKRREISFIMSTIFGAIQKNKIKLSISFAK